MTSVIHGAQVAIEIRRLGPEDAPILERIAADVFDEPVRPDRLAAYLAEPGHHLWVAIADGQVVAQAAAVVHRHPDKPTEFYVDEVGVTPALQRQGIARRMLEEPDNAAARGLYKRLGGKAGSFVMYEYEL